MASVTVNVFEIDVRSAATPTCLPFHLVTTLDRRIQDVPTYGGRMLASW
jgi:hypothetical protein